MVVYWASVEHFAIFIKFITHMFYAPREIENLLIEYQIYDGFIFMG